MRHLIMLNAPPGAGKDTATTASIKALEARGLVCRHYKVTNIVKQRTHEHWGVGHLAPDAFEACKDVPNQVFHGILSPREAYIRMGLWLKRQHGETWIVDHLAQQIADDGADVGIVSDVGSAMEACILAQAAQLAALVRIHRPGHTFAGDCREYVWDRQLPIGVATADIHNIGQADYEAEMAAWATGQMEIWSRCQDILLKIA